MKVELYRDYDAFAWFYNRYWSAEVPYQILEVVNSLLLQRLPRRARVLDLCCGTGQVAAALAKSGFLVTGVDGSKEMLMYARRNAPRSEFVLADARSFVLPEVYHAAVSTFDSLNHIMSAAELGEALRRVHTALVPNGAFLFDMNMEEGFLAHWRDYFSVIEDDYVCALGGEYRRDERIGQYNFTLFRLSNKMWRRSDFSVVERCYGEDEITSALDGAGFVDVSVYDAENDLGLSDHTGRKFFLAHKRARRGGRE